MDAGMEAQAMEQRLYVWTCGNKPLLGSAGRIGPLSQITKIPWRVQRNFIISRALHHAKS